MKVLSLFDGISCARVALKKKRVDVECYFASENDPVAIEVAQRNWSDQIQIGPVEKVTKKTIEEHAVFCDIDLLIGGSPCQDLSVAKRGRKGLQGDRSKLFFEYVRVLNQVKPKWFVLENVASMSKESKDEISRHIGVEPIMIDAGLVSAQSRKRLFWTNIPVKGLPKDRKLYLKDVMEDKVDPKYFVSEETLKRIVEDRGNLRTPDQKAACLSASMNKGPRSNGMTCIRVGKIGKGGQGDRVYSPEGKSVTLSANGGGRGAKTGLYKVRTGVRKLTPTECERLQCLPDGYTKGYSDNRRYQMLGNAFNVEVIAHIIKHIPKENE